MKKALSILIVDDHGIVASGLKMLIQSYSSFKVIDEASNAKEAIDLCKKHKPDIVILDISLPDINGLEIIKTLKKVSEKSKILILTMHDNKQYLKRALEEGVSGYLLKQSADEDLLYALKTVAKGEMYIQPSLLSSIYPEKDKFKKTREELLWDTLSDREKEVMLLVAKGFTNKEIAKKLLLSDKTVATYRARACSKLDITSKSEIVNLVFKLKLLNL